ncbi:hypothetical protein DRQ09_01135 [candidate division KSB1 bacterium]|nr:MAG: hypothetical protein DRQ09_01135 [candidate division KSB1 bacterium]
MKEILQASKKLIWYNVKILFSHKFFYFSGAAFLYFIITCVINYFSKGDHLSGPAVMPVLLQIPSVILIIFLSMEIVSYERENKTIESVFTVSGSIYKVWLIKLGVMYLVILSIMFIMDILSFFFVADFPVGGMLFHSFVPLLLIGNMTFYFSVRLRSGNAAGMITVIIVLFFLFLSEPLQNSRFFLFLNPYAKPRDLEIVIWERIVFQNRIGIIAISSLFLYLGLTATKKRERLL